MLLRLASTTTLFVSLLAAGAGLTGCTTSDGDDGTSTLTITNNYSTDTVITDIYINPVGDEDFTTSVLDSDLDFGDSVTVEVACDHYDVEIVDSDGFDCTVLDYDLCFTDDEWDIDEDFCTFASDRKAPVSTLHSPLTLQNSSPRIHVK